MSRAASTVRGPSRKCRDAGDRAPSRRAPPRSASSTAPTSADVDDRPRRAPAAGRASRRPGTSAPRRTRCSASARSTRRADHRDRVVLVELERGRPQARLARRSGPASERPGRATRGSRRAGCRLNASAEPQVAGEHEHAGDDRRDPGTRALARLPGELLLRGRRGGHGGEDPRRRRRAGRRATSARRRRRSGAAASGSISLRPATRETCSPANRTRSSAGAASAISASIRRCRASWPGVRCATARDCRLARVLIREVMTESVVTAAPERTVREIAELMRERNVGSVVLVDDARAGRLRHRPRPRAVGDRRRARLRRPRGRPRVLAGDHRRGRAWTSRRRAS